MMAKPVRKRSVPVGMAWWSRWADARIRLYRPSRSCPISARPSATDTNSPPPGRTRAGGGRGPPQVADRTQQDQPPAGSTRALRLCARQRRVWQGGRPSPCPGRCGAALGAGAASRRTSSSGKSRAWTTTKGDPGPACTITLCRARPLTPSCIPAASGTGAEPTGPPFQARRHGQRCPKRAATSSRHCPITSPGAPPAPPEPRGIC